MGKILVKKQICFVSFILCGFIFSCNQSESTKTTSTTSISENTTEVKTEAKKQKTILSSEFKKYWYAGEAEISSYKLEQARYGEIREGSAVLIFVTEDFLPQKQVKADHQNAENVPILKLNATKNFNTGIYPYSIMQSVFYPISNNQHALKVSNSIQEWCGHVYAQLNNRAQFEITSHSYFEGEADEKFNLRKTVLENELWTQLRIDPKSLPVGELKIIPSLEFTRLKHVPLKAFQATASLNKSTYSIHYPELNRTLSITFNPEFPFDILSWEESFKSGFGQNANILTTKATKLKTIKSAYWKKNNNENEKLRASLLLD
ncbi:septum formation inhibitor Maf [Tamlana sp. 2_MG-2023]|uniref:septum formation inhibitor Maf n=1 Tax=unclassified Tamlana TaxID=2614803 RepID=UPI0026E2B93D|nr:MULTISPECIES: septum formation inhibitor Maf [unclassified Tamlana]MDO6759190.1 septum formation inhibitor Maf [Tamlana sp. 2_MG-2023]MDO6790671.1 septum formation inhibitor Maf [Tamlana sp. 1_MG-2023]